MFPGYSCHTSHPLLSSPHVHKSTLCLFLYCWPVSKFFSTIFLDFVYICTRIWYLSFPFWLTSLCIIGSRFIHLIRTDWKAFLFMAEQYSIVYMNHNFFIHSSVYGHLGCFHVLAVVNSAAMNNRIHLSFSILVSSGYMPDLY